MQTHATMRLLSLTRNHPLAACLVLQVYKGLLHGIETVAIKVSTEQTTKQLLRFAREVEVLKSLYNGNVVRFLGANLQMHQAMMVMEYMPNGDLYQQIAADQAGDFLWYKWYDDNFWCPVPANIMSALAR